ncbi:MAG: GntR family transcriptional regulator [Clostridiaceae bacterium]|jgi:GntR family transcriptional regulator|nr:GntR family transcriptional regulator [Clostridiaceae bacterium]
MEFDEHIPIYLQIMEYVKVLIITGAAKPGDKLAAVREMASELGINPNTVQKAYQSLEEEGIIKGERGSGNYITKDEGIIRAIREELSRDITGKYIRKMKSYGFDRAEIIRILSETPEEKT